ncbi:MAG: hypothetical protein PVH61_36095 [Candidatus Aminicenantes bacterium]|jgi:hypothetical protein
MKQHSVLLLFLIASFAVIGFSRDITITKVGEWGTGYYNDVFVKGKYAYCAADEAGVDIIDIGNPANPWKVGNIDTPHPANSVYVSGNYAYVTVGDEIYSWEPDSSLQIIDITHPNHPILKGAYDITGAKALYVKDNYAYVTAGDRMKIIDVSNPGSPTLLTDFALTPQSIYSYLYFWGIDIHVMDNYAFIAVNQTYGPSDDDDLVTLEIIDISDPRHPRRVGIYEPSVYLEYPLAVYARGKYVYLATKSRLLVLDITKPAAPKEIGSCSSGSSEHFIGDIKVIGNYAYLASGCCGLQVVDISNPESPIRVGSFLYPAYGSALGVHLDGINAYVAYASSGLQVVNISKPNSPTRIGFYDVSPGTVSGLDSRGNYVYLATSDDGLKVIDLSDPSSPQLKGINDGTKKTITRVHISGSCAYVISKHKDLQILDISDPSSPEVLGNYEVSSANDVYVVGNYAYVAEGGEDLLVIDISDPSAPGLVGAYDYSFYGVTLYINGNYVYLGGYGGLLVLDRSNPAPPVKIGEYNTTGYVLDVYVNGNYAYAANGEAGLQIIDISNPASPEKIGSYDTPGYANNVFVSDDYAYVADDGRGLLVIDVSAPSSPTLMQSYRTRGEVKDVHVNDGYIYLADGKSGKLLILRGHSSDTIPQIGLTRNNLNFVSISTDPGPTSDPQSFSIINNGGGTLEWSLAVSRNWLGCSPTQGVNNGEVSVSVDASGLPPGYYTGMITITGVHAVNSPQTVVVSLAVYEPGETAAPFGVFATPIDETVVSGSIPVTGWVLDDIGVQCVQIYREKGKRLVYIGDAVFVEGVRPDVEQAYPWYPNNHKAGWGYMLLTNFLPNSGNGTFKIHAIATDIEGNQVTLGTKIISCDNANAVKPFGAIDTPTQGGTASGGDFVNFGWAQTPLPNTIPKDGSTITVWVDGVPLDNPVYNQYREDIASLFPGYNNSDGAGGYYYLDTTPYTNGVHTIQWTVTDDAGNTDGIGSRYFTIQNPGGSDQRMAQSAERTAVAFDVQSSLINLNPSHVPPDYSSPVMVKKGYNRQMEPQMVYPEESGNITIEIRQLERLEVRFTEGAGGLAPLCHAPLSNSKDSSTLVPEGFQVIGNRFATLPIGSNLDRETGIFTWQPGAGFLGEYRLVFLIRDGYGLLTMKRVHVKIGPKQ